MAYVDGFCSGLYRNFEEQKRQSTSFALALLVPEAVVKFVDEIPEMEEYNRREYEQKRENDVLRWLDMLTERRSRTPATRNG